MYWTPLTQYQWKADYPSGAPLASTHSVVANDTLADGSTKQYLITYGYDPRGVILSTAYTLLDGETPYTPVNASTLPTNVKTIRLDGSSATQNAIAAEGFVGGSLGREYAITHGWKSFSCMWSQGNANGTSFEINNTLYVAPSLLPTIQGADSTEIYGADIAFKAGAGAKIEITITY